MIGIHSSQADIALGGFAGVTCGSMSFQIAEVLPPFLENTLRSAIPRPR